MKKMKILKYRPIKEGGCLKGTFDLEYYVNEKYGFMQICDMKHFQKEKTRWVSFPDKEYMKDNEKKYYHYGRGTDPKKDKIFREDAREAVEKYLSAPKEDELPF